MIWLYLLAGIVLVFGVVVFRGAPYVPSHRRFVKRAFTKNLYEITEKDVLLDVGSGDGIVLRQAAACGARAIGYEINPILVVVSRVLAWKNPRIETKLADFWRAKFPDETTVVYAFAVTRDMPKLMKKMQKEADRLERRLWLITYGADLPAKKSVKVLQAHTLYAFEPLQGV